MTQSLLAGIRLFALDADGVLTDGGVYVFEDGREFRRFDIKDGLGLKRAMTAGIAVAIISAGGSEAVRQRARTLGNIEVHLTSEDKLATLDSVCGRMGITRDQAAYMGDDLTDLPVLEAVGLPCAPANAAPAVKVVARLITTAGGGYGAVREVCDLLVAARR